MAACLRAVHAASLMLFGRQLHCVVAVGDCTHSLYVEDDDMAWLCKLNSVAYQETNCCMCVYNRGKQG